MGQGVKVTNVSTESLSLPFPLAGMLSPGQSVILNNTAAQLAVYGIVGPGNSTLHVLDLGATYTGPYDTTGHQGSLGPDGSLSSNDFGDGTDGVAVADGTTSIAALGGAPSSSIYTMTRDAYFADLTVNAGVQIKTASFRLFVNGNLIVAATGIISNDGAAAAAGVAGAATSAQTLGGSFAGGAGGTAGGAGAAGTSSTTSAGGTGGAGGAATAGGAGGAASTSTAPTAAQGGIPRDKEFAKLGQGIGNAGLVPIKGGAGGSGGGADGANVGGGGGAGAAVLGVYARAVTNNGRITARGGAGAAGTAGNAGGGGGGGGGWAILVAKSYGGSGALDAAGGAAGAGAGTGAAGAAGVAGTLLKLVG